MLAHLSGERCWSHPSTPTVSINVSLLNLTSTAVNVKVVKFTQVGSYFLNIVLFDFSDVRADWKCRSELKYCWDISFGAFDIEINELTSGMCSHMLSSKGWWYVQLPHALVISRTFVKHAWLLSPCSRGQQVQPWLVFEAMHLQFQKALGLWVTPSLKLVILARVYY